tara:strand:- start:259 stop:474 length:216 start_codon:yes stop_codon:yes gene_type:complete
MDLIKFLLIIIVLIGFFFLLKHYNELENYKFNYNQSDIPVIEADNKPYKILPPPEEIINPLKNSCTLNDEC